MQSWFAGYGKHTRVLELDHDNTKEGEHEKSRLFRVFPLSCFRDRIFLFLTNKILMD
jgi:hypothetical protein